MGVDRRESGESEKGLLSVLELQWEKGLRNGNEAEKESSNWRRAAEVRRSA